MKHWFLNQPLSKKLILVLVVSGLVPMLIVGVFSLIAEEKQIKEKVFNKLESVRQIKASAVQRYFASVESQLRYLAENEKTQNAMRDFANSFYSVAQQEAINSVELSTMKSRLATYYNDEFAPKYTTDNEGKSPNTTAMLALDDTASLMQYKYIRANEHPLGSKHLLDAAVGSADYHRHHERYHPDIRSFLERFGYYDIFLVDGRGTIVYSVYKELDYATSLLNGPYADTNFAEAFKQAKSLQAGEVVLKDFASYLPSYDSPASFMATPIYQGTSMLGVLIFQMPLETINSIMGERSGLGESGETYLIGEDFLMRSDSHFDPKYHSVGGSFRHPEQGKVTSVAAKAAINGEAGNQIVIDYNGNPVLSSYAPISVEGLRWGILAEIDEAEAFASVEQLKLIILALAIACVICTALFAIYFSKLLTTPILALSQAIQNVERNGSFRQPIDNDHTDEIGVTSRAFASLLQNLSGAFSDTNRVLGCLAKGDYSQSINASYRGDIAVMTQGINSTVNQLREAQAAQIAHAEESEKSAKAASQAAEQAREQAQQTMIIKQALDVSATGIMITDDDFNIVYLNHAIESLLGGYEAKLRKVLPNFNVKTLKGTNIDTFHKNPSHQRSLLSGLRSSFKTELELSGLTFKLSATPIRDEHGVFLGAVVEWVDRTNEVAIESEIDTIVNGAVAGDFNQQFSMENKQGFFANLANNLNQLLSNTDKVINELVEVFSSMANGDLSRKITTDYQGDFATIKINANSTITKLQEVIEGISKSSSLISTGSKEISAGTIDLSSRTEEQASSLEETASSMEEMTTIVRQSEEKVKAVAELASHAVQIAREGNTSVRNTATAMAEINTSSTQIVNIIGVIDEIAFQTNLLALNAAVEAARAGEQGRGFAVVAGEVRNLAQRSANAAKEIKTLIADSANKVKHGTAMAESSGETLNTIVDEIEKVGKMMTEILSSASEQTQGINQVNAAVVQMDHMTQQNAALVEEASAASESMYDSALQMDKLVGFFRKQ